MRKTLKINVTPGSTPGTVNLTITEQSHRGNGFGDKGSDTFAASNGLRILSKCHPEVRPGSNEFYVRGTTNCGEDTVLQTTPEFAAKVLDAAAEYEAYEFAEIVMAVKEPAKEPAKEVVKEAAKPRVFPVFVLPSGAAKSSCAYYQWTDENNGFVVYSSGLRGESPIEDVALTPWLHAHKDQRVLTESEAADRIDLKYPVYIIPPARTADKHVAYSVWRDDTRYTSVFKDRTALSKDGYCSLRDYLRTWVANPGTQIVTEAEAKARLDPLPVAAPAPDVKLLPRPTDKWLKEHNVRLIVDAPRRPVAGEQFVSDVEISIIRFEKGCEGLFTSYGGLRWIVEEDTWPKYVKNYSGPGDVAVYFIWQKDGTGQGIGANGQVTHSFGTCDLEGWLKSWRDRGAKILTKAEAEALVAPKKTLNLQYDSKENCWTTFQVLRDRVYLTPDAEPGTKGASCDASTPALISKVFGGLCELNR